MPETFECDGVKITAVEPYQRQVTIHGKSSGLDVLLIHISDQLDQFAVCLKVWTDWIKEEDGMYFVPTTAWTLDKPECHPLRVFGKFFGSKRRCYIFPSALSQGVPIKTKMLVARTLHIIGDNISDI